jgi:hypothetical protein
MERDELFHVPQWSPPLSGGSTGHLRQPGEERAVAAMEPTLDRREHQGTAQTPDHVHGITAMEPAVERREHLDAGCRA